MLVQDFKNYLQETLGIQTQPMPWNNAKALPFLLLDRYEFFDVSCEWRSKSVTVSGSKV
jgi:hypothetical protein